jgi:hypothetical protein
MSIRITREQLIEALRSWEQEAIDKGWERRTDEERFAETADYLLEKMGFGEVPIPGRQVGTIGGSDDVQSN